MKRSACCVIFLALLGVGCTAERRGETLPISTEPELRNLFDKWERVWHEDKYDLVAECVQRNYIRHDEQGDRTVTREVYAAEITRLRQERPDIRVVVYDHSFEGNRA